MKSTVGRTFVALLSIFFTLGIGAAEQPNILWITAEDMSPTLGCYGDLVANTPNIDSLAKRSIRFTHAFASAPVCSPSRSCLINGLPATSQGTHQMRSAFPIPDSMTGFPTLLRNAGYFTANNVKTDYNTANWQSIIKASWDRQGPSAHWRGRPADQPFFCVFNLMTSHQSRTMVWPYDKFQKEVQSKLSPIEIHSPANAPIPPYYPNTKTVRKTVARYYDCVTVMDKQVGELLQQLDEDKLADDTIVFFYSDHGSGMPRHKRALLDSGMRVPLLVHFPQKWQRLAPSEPGTTSSQLIDFSDFAPTVLKLANLSVPSHMEGEAFLSADVKSDRQYVFGHRDRVDEVFDTARSVRGKRYLYIRTFMPQLGYNQPTAWPDLGEIRHEFYAAAATGNLTKPQQHFMGPTRPIEELYDGLRDPMNLHNLIDAQEHSKRLQEMREALRSHVVATRDLGFVPESLLWQWSRGTTPYEMARKSYDVAAVYDVANDVGIASEATLIEHLRNGNPAIRYWGAIGLAVKRKLSKKAVDALTRSLKDSQPCVRVQAADALIRSENPTSAWPMVVRELEHHDLSVVLHAARTIELLGDNAPALVAAMRKTDARMKLICPPDTPPTDVQPGEMDMAMFVGFSTGAFLNRVAKNSATQ